MYLVEDLNQDAEGFWISAQKYLLLDKYAPDNILTP